MISCGFVKKEVISHPSVRQGKWRLILERNLTCPGRTPFQDEDALGAQREAVHQCRGSGEASKTMSRINYQQEVSQRGEKGQGASNRGNRSWREDRTTWHVDSGAPVGEKSKPGTGHTAPTRECLPAARAIEHLTYRWPGLRSVLGTKYTLNCKT